MSKRLKILIGIIILAAITFLFFCVPLAVYPDSIGYFSYLKIFNGTEPLSTWDVIRGPSFPIILFVLTSLFGSAMFGILAGAYAFFIGLITVFYIALKKVMAILSIEGPMKFIAVLLFVGMIIFNPILFGYSHALLTEFVATFFALSSCLMAWRWLKVDFLSQKAKFILYSLFFVFEFIFIWFLKQPYLTIALFPLIIACVISIIKNHRLANIVQRLGAVVVCVLCLLLSISGWRSFLVYNGVDYKKASGADTHYISKGIIDGLSNTDLAANYIKDASQLSGYTYLSVPEKNEIIAKLDDSKDKSWVKILTIKSHAGRIIDQIPIFQNSEIFTVSDSIKLWGSVITKHPIVAADSYLSDYLAVADLYDYSMDSVTGRLKPIKNIGVYGHENHSIGLLYLYNPGNMDTWTRDLIGSTDLQYRSNSHDTIIKSVFGKVWPLYHGAYMLLFALLPFMLIYAVIRYMKLCKVKTSDRKHKYIYELVIILFGFSLLHVIFNIAMGAIIDRYAFTVFPEVALGFIVLIVTNKKIGEISKNICARFTRTVK